MSTALLKGPARVALVAASLAAFGLPVRSTAQERAIGGVGLTVFDEPGFRGRNATFRQDTPSLRAYGLSDRISSLRVGTGEIWEACEHDNYAGRCQVFSGWESDLRPRGWSDMISSVRRVRGGGPQLPVQPGGGLELFSKFSFLGDRRVVSAAIPDLGRVGFNDRAMSLRVRPGEVWEVCSEPGYRGCLQVNTEWADLRGLGMLSQISSVRPWSQGGGGPAPVLPGPEPGQVRLVLFDDAGFRGQSFEVTRAMPILVGFNQRAESARVSGTWEICERPVFEGRCVTVSSHVRNLHALGLGNQVGSARPRPQAR